MSNDQKHGTHADRRTQIEWTADYFREQGMTISDWALGKGHNPRLVYLILRGERKCLRGKSFQIAQDLQEIAKANRKTDAP